MKNDKEGLNDLWGHLLIKELIHHGVRHFCISPGARATPLIIAAANHPLAETFVHFDERGMAFHALGIAKGSNRPVALIVTSGTAVGNLLPAIMEGHADNLPLIVLSADRPPELQDCGANQTADQVKIFNNFVRWQGTLPCPDPKIPTDLIGTTVAQMMSDAFDGPVHLNCMFRKPLTSSPLPLSVTSRPSAKTLLFPGKTALGDSSLEELADELSGYEKGLILVSGTAQFEHTDAIYTLSRYLQWPIFPDIFSSIRSQGRGYGVIPYYDLILRSIGAHEDYSPDAILQIGDRFVSAKLTDWIASKKVKIHCQISSHLRRKDPIHSVTHRFQTDLNDFLQRIPSFISGRPPSEWFHAWKELNQFTEKGVKSYFDTHQDFSEPLLFHSLKDQIPSKSALFFSNSMSVRNGDLFLTPETPIGPIYGNRGLSGIDGNIATIAGLARGSGRPLIAFLGDLAFLHDINSLSLLQNLPVKLIVINNGGGDIFNFLPTGNAKEFFISPQKYLLKHAAPLFGLSYENPQTSSDLIPLLKEDGPLLIEVNTAQGQSLSLYHDLLQNLQEISSLLT
ncbi:MAG: 2-succinyl-5-enolpyruvyl-6-hydroxy-3-cyclohexene-1-carboxylic-acid synthase [Chlamydiia bacterium]|nr:2-succinyl-5-enolpyruvyl-6-hydroxy-3-cyclohexene-1-carboxylic-acid synthase [Chlamydiia bacterium]